MPLAEYDETQEGRARIVRFDPGEVAQLEAEHGKRAHVAAVRIAQARALPDRDDRAVFSTMPMIEREPNGAVTLTFRPRPIDRDRDVV